MSHFGSSQLLIFLLPFLACDIHRKGLERTSSLFSFVGLICEEFCSCLISSSARLSFRKTFVHFKSRKIDAKMWWPKIMIGHSVLPGNQSFGHPDFFSDYVRCPTPK